MKIVGDVLLGSDCKIAETAILIGPLVIGDRVEIGEYCVIGSKGEHRNSRGDNPHAIRIGDDTIIREHVVVQRGVLTDSGQRSFGTSIGRRCYIMHGAHIAHDCFVDDDVTMSPGVVLGGHTYVQRGANFGINSATHQNVTIGYCSMIGMGAVCVNDVNPQDVVVGIPAKMLGFNGRCRTQLTSEEEGVLRHAFLKTAIRPRQCHEYTDGVNP